MSKKKVLFISPNFFGYELLIKEELERTGFDVDWFNDRPTNNTIEKGILRIAPNLLHNKVKKYFNHFILGAARKKDYDYVFVILGQSFTKEMFMMLRKELTKSVFILYLWDSLDNFGSIIDNIPCFDKIFSFDPNDCFKYKFTFLPLFYNDISVTNDNNSNIIYDFSFIGTIKKGKLRCITSLLNSLKSVYNNYYIFMYLQSKLVFLFYKITLKEFRNFHMKDFKYKKKIYGENVKISKQSYIIIDVPMINQKGLTMRTFECLAYKRKMITTNNDVVNYDFYKPENIYVYDGTIDYNNIFFNSSYSDIDENVLEKYSLRNWIKQIFNI